MKDCNRIHGRGVGVSGVVSCSFFFFLNKKRVTKPKNKKKKKKKKTYSKHRFLRREPRQLRRKLVASFRRENPIEQALAGVEHAAEPALERARQAADHFGHGDGWREGGRVRGVEK